MKIIIDAMSGDYAPLEPIRGAVEAAAEYPVQIALVGNEKLIREMSEQEGIDLSSVSIIHADSVINMEDAALSVVRDKSDSSMSVGLRLLAAGEADAMISAGNTGALIAGATLLVRRIRGIRRAGIATILPFPDPVLLMDSGANLDVTPQDLEQFAFMGSIYMERSLGIRNPRIGLLNNGTEPTKGHELQKEAYRLLAESGLNFVGNIEGKTIPFGDCDVLVTDGFTGNVVLKYSEGMAHFMMRYMKDMFMSSAVTKLAGLTIRKRVQIMKRQFDASEYGGAPLLGISQPVFKSHGSSDATAIKNAVYRAIGFVNTGISRDIARYAIDFEERRLAREAEAEPKKSRRRKKKPDPGSDC